MLRPLTRDGVLEVWDDTKISPGQPWQEEIANALRRASIAVLLVTPDFLASDFIHHNELPPLLEAAGREGLKVLWIAISACLYTESPIARFQAVNDPTKPLDRYLNKPARLNEEILKIAQLIKAAAAEGDRTSPAPQPAAELYRKSKTWLPATRESLIGSASRNRARKLSVTLIAVFLALGTTTALPWLWSRSRLAEGGENPISNMPGLLSSISKQHVEQMRSELVRQLIPALRTMLAEKPNDTYAWTVAQMAVALSPLGPSDSSKVVEYLNATKDGKCGCWREYGTPHYAGPSYWALLSLGKIKSDLEPDALEFLLHTQKPNGSWSIALTTADPSNSATYPTSWALVVLDGYQRKQVVPLDQRDSVDQAIARGRQLLLRMRTANKARWRDYWDEYGVENISDSGLALHVLKQLGVNDEKIDRLWLQNLPQDPITANESDKSDHRIQLETLNYFVDSIRRYKLPWVLIATRDAYANGSSQEHDKAQRWVDKLLSNPTEITLTVANTPHVAAELLIALRYLDGDSSVL
jgi:hypothetical protein